MSFASWFADFRGPFEWQVLDQTKDDARRLLKACIAECLAVVTSGCHTKDVKEASGVDGKAADSLKHVEPGACFISSTSALLNIALAFGFTLFVVIYFTASFSGGHINPAVTLACFLTKKISLVRGFLYIAVQCGGAAIASIILKGLDPDGYKAAAGASNQIPEGGFSAGSTLGFEIIVTFGLVVTVFAATDPRQVNSSVPLPIVVVAHLILIPVDGCSINPARSFGTAVVSRTFNHYWIFWVGPFIGAIIAPVLYELAFHTFDPPETVAKKGDLESAVNAASVALPPTRV